MDEFEYAGGAIDGGPEDYFFNGFFGRISLGFGGYQVGRDED
jgi:hypothetical protein